MPRFTITTLLWLTALFATGMGTFGPTTGLLLASGVCVLHAVRWGKMTCVEWLVVGGVALVLIALLLPNIQAAREASRRNQSLSQTKQLVLAMHNYHDTHGVLPPAYTVDKDGTPQHSWRALLLNYLEEQPLHQRIRFDEPWDSDANAKLLDGLALDFITSPRTTRPRLPDETHYLAVVDEDAVFRPGRGVTLGEVPDGLHETIVLIEAVGRGIRWHEPRDLTMEEAIDLLTGEADEDYEWIEAGFFVSTRYRGDGVFPRNVAFADGRARAIGHIPTRELARALLTRAGGEEIPEEIDSGEYNRTKAVVGHTVHWRRVLSTTLFVGLAVGPFFRRRNPMEATGVEEVNHEVAKTRSS